ncbi:uncharacterized protein LOC128206244 [Mya arenaria]|uniref:uncharacterized protein LOC128206244 n=1 Tax=Mya arenaria TaxID=6604 RepID=UPI0022E206F1|nr:uncharacterized protein LOC128206244 [Mya arenaria]
MGQKPSKKPEKISEQLMENYLRAEFKAMDRDEDNRLSRQEAIELLTMIGCNKAKRKMQEWDYRKADIVLLEDYIENFKDDKYLQKRTMKYRQLFRLFDKNADGRASKQEIINGLESICIEQLDIEVDDSTLKTIEQMGADKDGKITYEEFLTKQFQILMEKDKPAVDKGETSPHLTDDEANNGM